MIQLLGYDTDFLPLTYPKPSQNHHDLDSSLLSKHYPGPMPFNSSVLTINQHLQTLQPPMESEDEGKLKLCFCGFKLFSPCSDVENEKQGPIK